MFLKTVLMLILAGVAFAQPETVRVQLRWKHQFQFAGYYAAIYKGFYTEAGLNVVLLEGGDAINPVEEVLGGKAQFGISNSSLVVDYLCGRDVLMLGPVFQHSPNVLLAHPSVKSPVDLARGGKVALMGGDQDIELKAMFLKEGIALGKLRFVPKENHLEDLLAGKVAAINGYSSNEPYLLLQRGIPFSVLEPRSYGLDFYGDTLFTSKAFAKTHPQTVEKFREATFKGWQYALDHPDEIIELIAQTYNSQQKSRDHLAYEAGVLRELVNPDLVQIGHSNPGRWENIVETYRLFGLAGPDRPLEGFYFAPDRKTDMTWFYLYLGAAALVIFVLISIVSYIYRINLRLGQSARRDRILFQNAASAGLTWRAGFVITHWNDQAQKLFGWSAQEAIGRNFMEFLVPPEERETVQANLLRVADEGQMYLFTNRNLTKDGRTVVCEWYNTLLPRLGDALGEVMSQAIDITERHQAQLVLEEQARLDPLTRLANRHHFETTLEKTHALARRHGHRFAVAFIDLDGFKQINDTYGHDVGDELLKVLARRFEALLRKEDLVARLGGDEFALILHAEACERIAEEVLRAASRAVEHQGHALQVSASIGMSFYSSHNDAAPGELLRQADTSMYHAKHSGKNRYHIYA